MLLRQLATVLVAAVCLAGMAIFFRITEIQVAGNQIYTAEQVVEASGLTVGENLLTIQKRTASGRIMAALPYVSAVHMERVLPSTVVITVTESDAAYLVEAEDGSQWLMSSGGRLLEEAGVTAADYPQLVGFLVQAPEVGAQAASEQAENLAAAETVLALLEETEFLSQIVEINVERSYDIVLWYGTLFEIHLGGTDQMEYKMQYLTAILADERVAEGGVIDLSLSGDNGATYTPWNEALGQTEPSAENSTEIS